MAYTILTETYGRRLPKITATADSTDDLTALGVEFAEGSTVNVGGTVYSLDKVNGWVVPGSSGGGDVFSVTSTYDEDLQTKVLDKTYAEIDAAYKAGKIVIVLPGGTYLGAFRYDFVSGALSDSEENIVYVTDIYTTTTDEYHAASSSDYPVKVDSENS